MSEPINPFAPSAPHAPSVSEHEVPYLEPPQSVRFPMTPEMLAAFWSHRTHTSVSDKWTRRNNAIVAVGLVITAPVVLVVLTAIEKIPWWIGWLAMTYTVLIVWWFLHSLRRATIDAAYLREARRMMDEAAGRQVKGERLLTIELGGVHQRLPHGESFIRWRGYERIEHTLQHAFFYESSLAATIIPRTAFASQSQFLGFVRLAQRLWQEQQANDTDQPSPNADAV